MAEGTNRQRQRRQARRGSADLAAASETPVDRLDATPIDIGGRVFWVGELGIDESVAIAQIVGAAAVRMNKVQRAELATIAGKTQTADLQQQTANLLAILQVFDGPTVRRLFGALLDVDEQWVKANVKLRHMLRIVAALLKHNDLDELRGPFSDLTTSFERSVARYLESSQSSPSTGSPNGKPDATAGDG